MTVVKKNGPALEFTPEDLQRDREIVMAAVNQVGWALEFESQDLQKDKDIVLAAVNQDGSALEFASLELQGDCDVVLEAAEHNHYSLKHANLTRLARDNTTSPAKFCKILSCFNSITSIFTLIREKPDFVQYELLQ